jgi:TRAP-type C4-dicarboxylate transport system substrate-binding protein
MNRGWKGALIFAAAVISWLALGATPMVEAQTYEFKISLETVPNHSKTMGVDLFIQELVKRSEGRLKPQLFHSAQLYKDVHVTKAVDMGTVQMAVVGNYLLDGFDINATLTHLPMFFGQPLEVTMRLLDGEVGKRVSKKLQEKLSVKVIGRVFEMGFDNCYTLKKKITKVEDFKGLRLRHAGGAISTARFQALGAEGVVIAWPDVPMALSRGTIDGLATTTKSVESAKLHEAGLKYGLECRNHVSYYFPLVNLKFWKSLPPDLQKIFIDVWDETVPKEREIAREEQRKAKVFLQTKGGMEFVEPSVEELAIWRRKIMPIQDGLVTKLKYDPELVKLGMKALGM